MRVLYYVLAVVISVALVVGAGVLIGAHSPRNEATLVLAIAPITFLVFGPLMLGSLASYWNTRDSSAARKSFRPWLITIAALEVVGVILIIIYAVINGLPAWIPVVVSAGGAALTGIALLVGRSINRQEERRRPFAAQAWVPISADEVRRKVRAIVVATLIGFVVGAGALAIFAAIFDGDSPLAIALVGGAQLGFFAGAITGMMVTLLLNRRVRDEVTRDLGLLTTLGKVVLRNKDVLLDDEQQVLAAKFAAISAIAQPFQFVWLTLLYLQIGTLQISLLVGGGGNLFSLPVVILLAILLVVLAPIFVRQWRRTRDYAHEHAHLLAVDGSPSEPTTADA